MQLSLNITLNTLCTVPSISKPADLPEHAVDIVSLKIIRSSAEALHI